MTAVKPHRALFAALSIAALVGAVSCATQAPEEVDSETVVPVKTAPATRGAIRGVVHATGIVTPAPGADLLVVAPDAARITAIPHAAGDRVRRGDVLVEFEIPGATAELERQQAEVSRARAALDNATSAQARAHDLFDRGVAARRDVEDADRAKAEAEASLAQANASRAAAQVVAGRATVRATFDGVVAKRYHNPGDLVEASSGDPVLRVIDPRRLEVVASVPLADVSRIKVGATARVSSAPSDAPEARLSVLSLPAAVEPGTATVPVRLGVTGDAAVTAGAPVEVDIQAEQHDDAVLVPVDAIVREGEETAVFVANAGKAERRSVEIGLVDGAQVEIVSGLQGGRGRDRGRPGGSARRRGDQRDGRRGGRGPVNIAGLALRHSRAVGLLAVALVVSGVFAAVRLPSGIYPPLQFPRIVVVAHSGTLPPQSMSLIVTRPIEQVIMAVPGVRRVRSRSIRGASEISAQFDPATDMIVALQMVQNRIAEITGDLPADTEMQVERMTPEVFPDFILSLTGTLPTADLYDYANYVMKPELARVPGAGIIEVQASDTREIEVILDPARLAAAGLTVVDVADTLKAQNTILPVGRFQESGQQRLALATGLWKDAGQIAQAPREGAERRDAAGLRPGRRHAGSARSHHADHRQRPRRRLDQHRAANRRQHPQRQDGRGRRARPPLRRPAERDPDQPRLRPGGVRRGIDRQRARCDPDRRLARHPGAAGVPPRLAAHDDRRDYAADGGDPDVRVHVAVRRHGQPHVDGRTGRRDRPRDRRCGRRGGEHPPAGRRGRVERGGRRAAADGAARELDADHGRRLCAAGPAVRRAGAVLPRAVDEPLGRGPDLPRPVRHASCR